MACCGRVGTFPWTVPVRLDYHPLLKGTVHVLGAWQAFVSAHKGVAAVVYTGVRALPFLSTFIHQVYVLYPGCGCVWRTLLPHDSQL